MIDRACRVAGHDHELTLAKTITQTGTGDKADLWECPTGRYRYFVLQGNEITDQTIRFTRPRWGWSTK